MNPAHLTLAAIAALAAAGARRRGSRARIGYKAALLGDDLGDEEWDEPVFRVFHALTEKRDHPQFTEIWGDYDPAEDDDLVTRILLDVLPDVANAFTEIGLRHPFVALADLSDQSHLARFVNGTESQPVVLIDPEPSHDIHPGQRRRYFIESLLHEGGHAYLRTTGIEYDDEEEDVVENYARSRNAVLLYDYARRLA